MSSHVVFFLSQTFKHTIVVQKIHIYTLRVFQKTGLWTYQSIYIVMNPHLKHAEYVACVHYILCVRTNSALLSCVRTIVPTRLSCYFECLILCFSVSLTCSVFPVNSSMVTPAVKWLALMNLRPATYSSASTWMQRSVVVPKCTKLTQFISWCIFILSLATRGAISE